MKDKVDITSNIFVLSWLSSAKTVKKKREERTKHCLAVNSSFFRENLFSFHGEQYIVLCFRLQFSLRVS